MSTTPANVGGSNMLNGLYTQQLAALTGVLGGQHSFNQAQLASLTVPGGVGISNTINGGVAVVSQQQLAAPVQPTVAVENKSSSSGTSQNGAGPTSDPSFSYLPWPIVSPMMTIPYFDLPSYRLVNLDVAPSRDVNGFDLPLADVPTLRFFFNLGVQHSRSLAATQLYQERLAHGGAASTLSSVNQSPHASLPPMSQLGGINLLPSVVQLGGSRALEQYLGHFNVVSPQAQALFKQTQSHHITQQAQALASATTARLSDRHLSGFPGSTVPLHADILAMAAQLPISVSVSLPTSQLLRQPILPNGGASISSISTVPSVNSKQIPSNAASAEQQAYFLQQALSAVANAQNEKAEMRLHMLQQQAAGLGLHAFVRPTPEEVLKPVAVGGGSSDAALSPRPPPVDPTPPRIVADAVTTVSDEIPSAPVHQQAQTSSHVSRDQYAQKIEKGEISRNATPPQSARGLGPTSHVISRLTPQGSSPSTPVLTADDVVPVSQTLFQVSEQHFTEAFNAIHKKSIPNPIGIARKDNINTNDDNVAAEGSIPNPNQAIDRKDLDEKPALAPILMMTYLSNCMNNIKSTLNTNGVPVGLDANGRAVDYSSRPIDPIFQQARARMENAREFREISPSNTISQLSSSRSAVTEDGSRFSPTSVAPKTTSSSLVCSKSSSNLLGINRIVPDSISLERIEHDIADSDSPVEKRMRVSSDGE